MRTTRTRTKGLGTLAAAATAAAFLWIVFSLPPAPLALPVREAPADVAGAFHIHTNRSDGSGSPDAVAEAAARAGLQFVVLTDHGDGTREPDPPAYRAGVLVLDAVELSTQDGHYIALGMPRAPYPLRGDARDVAEDVRRLGGIGIVAHPDSPKPELQWRDWTAPFDGIEWLNGDSEWRDERTQTMVGALARYPFRATGALVSLLDRPERTLARWDAVTRTRRVFAVAGADAHARLGWRDDEANGYRRGWYLAVPAYEASLGAFSIRAKLAHGLTGHAANDAREVLAAIRDGRTYSAIDGMAAPPAFDFAVEGPTLRVRTNAPAGSVIILRRNGVSVSHATGQTLAFDTAGHHGTYRAEVYLDAALGDPPLPWIVSNPQYLQPDGWGMTPANVIDAPTSSHVIQGGPWHIERSEGSSADVSQTDYPRGPVAFRYQLASGERAGQYAALGIAVGTGLAGQRQIAFRAAASKPMRLSVQARQPQSGDRWQRSVYLDRTPRDIVVQFDEMRPMAGAGRFDPARADTVLLVADTTNSAPGESGEVTIENFRVER